MNIFSSLQKWLLIFIFFLLPLPFLNIYQFSYIPGYTKDIFIEYDFMLTKYKLGRDIDSMLESAQAYIIFSQNNYAEDFFRYSSLVTKRELQLFNLTAVSDYRSKLETLINLTDEYALFFQKELTRETLAGWGENPALRERYKALTAELSKASLEFINAGQGSISAEADKAIKLQYRVSVITAILTMLSLLMLVTKARRDLFPVLVEFQHFDTLLDSVSDAALTVDPKGKIMKLNKAAEGLFNNSRGQLAGKNLGEIIADYPPAQKLTQPLINVLLNEEKLIDRQVFFTVGSEKKLFNVDYYPLYFLNKLTGSAMVAKHIQMPKDKRYLMDAIESERKKISIEIHDWIGRGMSPIIHSLDYLLRAHEKNMSQEILNELVKLRGHCQSAAMDMRAIMNDIHPYLIEKVGLIPALESYVANFEQMHGIMVYIYYRNRILNLAKSSEIIVYRIVQEAMSNVIKHSNATEVDIYFKEQDGSLTIDIIDNGKGPEYFVAGKGLWGMKERANLIGGDLVYKSKESGFLLSLTVPLTPEGSDNGNS